MTPWPSAARWRGSYPLDSIPRRRRGCHPTPDQAYSIRLEYQKDGHRLLVDSDSPLIPDTSLHDAIVYRALMLYGLYDANPDAYAHGERQFNQLLSLMVERYTKPVVFAPLSLDQELVPEVPHLV